MQPTPTSPRRRLAALAAAVAVTVAVVVIVVAQVTSRDGGSPPSPGPTGRSPTSQPFEIASGPLQTVDGTPGGARFPGGVIRLTARSGGRWLVVYQRVVGDTAEVFAREAADLLGPYGQEVMVSSPDVVSAYDPNAIEFPGGRVIVTWTSRQAIWYAERLEAGRYGPPRELFSDPGGADSEQTLATLGDTRAILYNFHPFDRGAFLWDPRLRTLSASPAGVSVGPSVTIATSATGYGTEGVQRRVTAASTGSGQEVIAVWAQHAAVPCDVPKGHPGDVHNCGPRPIYGAVSGDGGTTWGPVAEVISDPGHDLVNPFVILIAPNDLRIYFTVDRHIPGVGYVRSIDHGRTWGAVHYVQFPPGVSAARMVMQVDPAHGLVGLFTERGFGRLVALRLEVL